MATDAETTTTEAEPETPTCPDCGGPLKGLRKSRCFACKPAAGGGHSGLTPEEQADRDRAIVAAVAGGDSAVKAAGRFGVSRMTVYNALRRAGVADAIPSGKQRRAEYAAMEAIASALDPLDLPARSRVLTWALGLSDPDPSRENPPDGEDFT